MTLNLWLQIVGLYRSNLAVDGRLRVLWAFCMTCSLQYSDDRQTVVHNGQWGLSMKGWHHNKYITVSRHNTNLRRLDTNFATARITTWACSVIDTIFSYSFCWSMSVYCELDTLTDYRLYTETIGCIRSHALVSCKYRLMSLGRAAPVANARLPLTEANVVSEDCGRGRGPSYTTPPSYSLHASCGWERSGHPHFELCTPIQRRCCPWRSETSATVRGDITFARGIRQASALTTRAARQVTLTYLKRAQPVAQRPVSH